MNEKFKHHYKKEFGQHFLLNPQMHEKIVNFVKKEIDFNESETLNVFEIGPGAGHLSGAILKHLKPRNFIMIEKDFDLQNHLIKTFDLENEAQKSFSKHDGESCIKLIFEDAMRVDFENLIFSEMKINKEKEKICLIANLPYNIATKLLIDLFEIQSNQRLRHHRILMMQ
jgi:16S rRNA A1518/A1519 N6-dimethyltransferase RsmA/KsgA/DIM1 with predicted DNA glycosylase/AP lyase activity